MSLKILVWGSTRGSRVLFGGPPNSPLLENRRAADLSTRAACAPPFYSCLISILMVFLFGGCVTTESDGGGDSPLRPMYGVLLDPGHGGEPEEAARCCGERFTSLSKAAKQGYKEECYGAISASGYKEKTATLAVCKKVKSLLEQAGIRTAMTRSSDHFCPLNSRVAKALSSEYRDWVFVSVHFNRSSAKQQATNLQAKYRNPKGFEIYVLPARGESSSSGNHAPSGYLTANNTRSSNFLLARSMKVGLEAMGVRNRGIKEAWFVILRGSPMPSVLIEGGFLSNPEEGKLIGTEDYQWKLAKAIFGGIKTYREKTSPTTLVQSKSELRFAEPEKVPLRDNSKVLKVSN